MTFEAAEHGNADTGLVERVPAIERWDDTPWGLWDRFKRWFWVDELVPMPGFQAPVEDPPDTDQDPRFGICCSGGGIRSASFNLGVLQELGSDRLQETKYLAAVSGGSYIAAAFAMVAKTRQAPDDDDSDPDLVTDGLPPFYPGSPEEQYLRNRASYMAPVGGGRLRFAWRVFCGLLVNLTFIASATVLVAALVAVYYRYEQPRLRIAGEHSSASPHSWVWGASLLLGVVGVAAGLFLVVFRPINERISRRVEAWSLRLTSFALFVLALEVILPGILAGLEHGTGLGKPQRIIGGGVGGTAAGIFAAVLLQVKETVSAPVKAVQGGRNRFKKLAPPVRRAVIKLAAYVLGPLLLVGIFIGATLLQVVSLDGWWLIAPPVAAVSVLGPLYVWGDLTSWSLHPFYRRRLCTAFALKRVKRVGIDGEEIEHDRTGRAVERDQSELVKLSATRVLPQSGGWPSKWPTLVVCAAANVSDPGATPPGRSVTSFTFSSEAIGGSLIGGIRTSEFEKQLPEQRLRDFNLPAVVAMSRAALAPSMGKLTRPSLRFLMGLANVRLGVWVANPRRLDTFIETRKTLREEVRHGTRAKAATRVSPRLKITPKERDQIRAQAENKGEPVPRPRPIYLLKELLGRTSVNDKFLYVTDGGHYENLGLVELLRRGCTRVYCFDASGGKDLRDLGDAIALARSELGAEIEFDTSELSELKESELEEGDHVNRGLARRACVTGTIRYTRGKEAEGRIVYAPTVLTPDAPVDLHAFKARDTVFPHHSTADQLFTDQKFEAYRVLGRHAARAAIKAMESDVPTRPGSVDRSQIDSGARRGALTRALLRLIQ